MKIFERILCIIVGVVLLYMWPLKYLYETHDGIVQNHIMEETIDFTEYIKGEGHLTYKEYEDFLLDVGKTGLYTVEIEVAKPNVSVDGMEVVEYETVFFTGEILEQLEKEGVIYFDIGDYITIKIYKRVGQEDTFIVVYGGKITNEFRTIRKNN